MKRDRVLPLLALILLLPAAGLAQDPFPSVQIPGVPSADYCLWRFNKSFDGTLNGVLQSTFDCRTGQTQRSSTQIAFRVLTSGGPECDEEVPGVPANLFLQATGSTLRRADGLAHFSGRVVLRDGALGPTIFRGHMELTARIGTHQALGEACNEIEHVEGWIVARGAAPHDRLTLRAQIAGQADLPNGLAAVPPLNRITGVIVQAP